MLTLTLELLVDHADFQGRPPPPDYSLYKAKFKTSRTGNVSSRDKHINEDGEALLQFLHQHNSPPSLIARFYGIFFIKDRFLSYS